MFAHFYSATFAEPKKDMHWFVSILISLLFFAFLLPAYREVCFAAGRHKKE